METTKTTTMENDLEFKHSQQVEKCTGKKYDCPVCGMDDWCGTDGCPMDPQ